MDLGILSWLKLKYAIFFSTFLFTLLLQSVHVAHHFLSSLQIQVWVSLLVCNFAILASAFFKLSNTTPDGTIYSNSGRRVGVVPPRQSLINFSPPSKGRDGVSEEERSGSIALSKLDITIDLELGDVPTASIARTKSPSPTRMSKGQHADLRV